MAKKGQYYIVRFKKGEKEWSERWGGSKRGNQSPKDIKDWLKRVQRKGTAARLTGAKISSIKTVTPKKKTKREASFSLF